MFGGWLMVVSCSVFCVWYHVDCFFVCVICCLLFVVGGLMPVVYCLLFVVFLFVV